MRRKDRQVIDRKIIDDIISNGDVLRVGLSVNDDPYIVPMNFGYDGLAFYIHCAKQGKKIDMIKRNPNICFEVTGTHSIIMSPDACEWTCKFESVMGKGTACIIEDIVQKRQGLDVIMDKYAKGQPFEYSDNMLLSACVIKIEITEIIGKSNIGKAME